MTQFPDWPEDIETSRDQVDHMKRLVKALRIAWDALDKMPGITPAGRPNGPIVTSEHYEACWLDCVQLADHAMQKVIEMGK